MSEKWLRTDEEEESVSSLEMVVQSLSNVEYDWYQWKWAILAVHSSLQGFMVMALRGSNGLNCLKDEVATEWLRKHRAGEILDLDNVIINGKKINPLDTFLNLYKKIKKPIRICFYNYSGHFKPSCTQGNSIKKLNGLRNDFVHFLPKSWILEITGLPQIFEDCLNIIDFLGWQCGNIHWFGRKHLEKGLQRHSQRQENCADTLA